MEIYLLCSHRPLAAISPLKKFKLHLRRNGSTSFPFASRCESIPLFINMSVQGIWNSLVYLAPNEYLFNHRDFTHCKEIRIEYKPLHNRYMADLQMVSSIEDTNMQTEYEVKILTDINNVTQADHTDVMTGRDSLAIVSMNEELFKVEYGTDHFKYCGNVYYYGDCDAKKGISGTFLFENTEEYIALKRYYLLNQLLSEGRDLKGAMRERMVEGLKMLVESEYWNHRKC